jgi:hypothetical protein
MAYKLYAEWEIHMEDHLGDFDTMEAAEKRVVELENLESLIGAEIVLHEVETGKQWLYTDRWEPLEDITDEASG